MSPVRTFLIAAVLVAAFGAAAAAATDDAAAAPRTILGADQFDLAAYKGKVLVVDFWASWCKPCKESLPWLSGLAAAHGEQGLAIVAVNVEEDLDKGRKLLDALDPAIVVVHDPEGKLAARYELQGMPSAFVYDRSGELKAKHVGFLPAAADAKAQEILQLLQEKGDGDAH